MVRDLAGLFEKVEKIVGKLSEKDIEELMHSLNPCVLMANKFSETRKPEYYVRMKANCEEFLNKLKELENKANF